ncbi:MAG: hypothetical protein FWB93_02560 [Oscillospiraceae bacterium]|nr:hypothetical protein [Oscillospiraceae bacterium]
MKKYTIAIIIALILALLLGCSSVTNDNESQDTNDEINADILNNENDEKETNINDIEIECNEKDSDLTSETNDHDHALGGGSGANWNCYLHAPHFCKYFLGNFLSAAGLTNEEFHLWAGPLRAARTSLYDECTVNIATMIEYFNIRRETIEEMTAGSYSGFCTFLSAPGILDILFSGDREMMEEFFCIENHDYFLQLERDTETKFVLALIRDAQEIIDANASPVSRHFNDIYTFVRLISPDRLFFDQWSWIRDLLEVGDYDSINIATYISRFHGRREHYLGPQSDALLTQRFLNIVAQTDLELYMHINAELLMQGVLSGDMSAIKSYYSIENQAMHNAAVAQVQAARQEQATQ